MSDRDVMTSLHNNIKYSFPIYIQAYERNQHENPGIGAVKPAMWNLTQSNSITAFTLQIDLSIRRSVMLVNGTPVSPATEPQDQNVASSTLTHDSHPAGAFTSSQQ